VFRENSAQELRERQLTQEAIFVKEKSHIGDSLFQSDEGGMKCEK